MTKSINLRKLGFVTKYKKMNLGIRAAKALLKAKEFLPCCYNFKILDANRTISEQRKIIQKCEKDFKKKFPKNWNNLLTRYTGGYKWLESRRFSSMSHLGGGAVDLTIISGKKELDMGGVKYSDEDNINYFEKKKNLSKREKKIKENRRLLKAVMRKAGFKSYNPEWWHWGFGK